MKEGGGPKRHGEIERERRVYEKEVGHYLRDRGKSNQRERAKERGREGDRERRD